ncbi:hypothetical protein DBV33_22575 [Pseudomonas fluorescens]|nr:hypothetical protein DBV33_22575 [Pseudomonas fluorescens]
MPQQIKYLFASGKADFTRTGTIANIPAPLTDLEMTPEGAFSQLSNSISIDLVQYKGQASEVQVQISLADPDNPKVVGYHEYRNTADHRPSRELFSFDISNAMITSIKTQLTPTTSFFEITQLSFEALSNDGDHKRTITGTAKLLIDAMQ